MLDLRAARENMVECQILPANVRDSRVREAMQRIPRESFVPENYASLAYSEAELPVGPMTGSPRKMMSPSTLARLIDVCELRRGDLALDVGCMTGYSAIVLADLCEAVVGLEIEEELAARASELVADLGVTNVAIVPQSLEAGYPEQGPYDVIFLDGAVRKSPERLLSQLKDGGRLVCVLEEEGASRACLYTRANDKLGKRVVFDATIPFLPGFAPTPVFQF